MTYVGLARMLTLEEGAKNTFFLIYLISFALEKTDILYRLILCKNIHGELMLGVVLHALAIQMLHYLHSMDWILQR